METPTPEEQPVRARLFVALALPAATREAVAGWCRDAFSSDARLRLVDAEALHVTLAFLGWRASTTVERIADAALAGAGGRLGAVLTPTATAALPVRRPRVVALDLHDERERAAAIQAAVVESLVAAGLFEPERRPFRPHLTVARVRGKGNVRLGPLPAPPGDRFEASEVVVYRSDLSPSGARYTPLASVELPGQEP